jgi:hypothetical protein
MAHMKGHRAQGTGHRAQATGHSAQGTGQREPRLALAFHPFRAALLLALVVASASCGDVVRSSRAPVMLAIDSLGGATPTTLFSDVVNTTTAPCSAATPCVFDDSTIATLAVVMKNVTVAPTTNNQVTIDSYHVTYQRADGRNTPGVDVPFPFDGAVTGTIPAGAKADFSFEIVRHVAKVESPLIQLRTQLNVISTIAQITFFGHDQVGNEVSVTGSVLVNFGNFPDSGGS